MARPAVDLIRRKELIRATMTAIHRAGLAEPTVAAICKYAGLSSVSIVNHYFKSKQDLLECTMRDLAGDFLGEVALRAGSAQSPTDRVFAVIDANFAPSQCTPEAVSSWLWFWSRTPSSTVFADIERATHRHIITELKRGLALLLPANEVDDAAEGLMALMYGMWLRFALNPKILDVEAARRITRDHFLLRLQASAAASGPVRF
ncbi:MAG TPA: transcriptional regulator BetI [Steroidobacteraceae bacterium]|nr:transcriptional regulator BetI [Steroidobacteraceae bacterium]